MIEKNGSTLPKLADPALAESYRVVQYAEIGSTNDVAIARAMAGDPGRLWIVADAQTKGRGRHGRQWSSPHGNLYASLLLLDPSPVHKAPELGFVAAVALMHSLRASLGDDPRLRIKWPNDILYADAKLAGILLESTQLKGGGLACVAGIGVNCCSHPATALYPATDLAGIGTLLSHRDNVFSQLSAAFVEWLRVWDEGRNFPAIRSEWMSHAAGLGTRITISTSKGPRSGIFETIDAVGRIVLNAGGQEVTLEAGDVFLNSPPMAAPAGMRAARLQTVSREDHR